MSGQPVNLEEIKAALKGSMGTIEGLLATADRQQATIARLAAALKECVRKLDTCEKSYRLGGGQDFANSIAQVSSDARAALREAGIEP